MVVFPPFSQLTTFGSHGQTINNNYTRILCFNGLLIVRVANRHKQLGFDHGDDHKYDNGTFASKNT